MKRYLVDPGTEQVVGELEGEGLFAPPNGWIIVDSEIVKPPSAVQWSEGGGITLKPEPGPEPEPEPQPETPQWDSFLRAFSIPGNPLYSSVVGKVAQAGFMAQDHWANFKLLLATPGLRSPVALAASIGYLATLLSDAEHPLSESDISAWNGLMEDYGFPEECQL